MFKSSGSNAIGLVQSVRPRAFCIMSQRVKVCSKVKLISGAVAKASLNRAIELQALDPKPSDLSLSRLKLG